MGVQARYDLFVAEYLVDRNATQAAIRAGYAARSAHAQGSQLLKNIYVSDRLASIDSQHFETKRRSVDATIEEIAKLSHSDLRELFKEDGSLKHPLEWPDDIARCVASVDVFEEFEGRGEERELVGVTKRIKLWSKIDALTLKAKHQKLLVERVEHTHTIDIGPRLRRARERQRAKTIEHDPGEAK